VTTSPPPPRGPLRLLVDHFEEGVAGVALVLVVGAVVWGVITRYVTAQPAAWASEVATISFAWLVFFGASACFKYGVHPSIDMLTQVLSPAAQRAVRWFNHVLLIAFFLFMVGYGIHFSIEEWENPTSVLRLPLTILYGPVTMGFALMLLRYLAIVRREFDRRGDAP